MFKEKIKSLVEKKTGKDNKKSIENLVVFLVLLIITIISINVIWGKNDKTEQKSQTQDEYKVLAENQKQSNISEIQAYNLEDELEDILSKISGVGKVQVLVTYSETSEVIAMQNNKKNISKTEESDTNRRDTTNRNNR